MILVIMVPIMLFIILILMIPSIASMGLLTAGSSTALVSMGTALEAALPWLAILVMGGVVLMSLELK